MPDVFLIIATVVAFVILFLMAVYLLVYYQHPDDHNEAWLPKFVVVFGFILAGATVLALPLDVANNEGYAGCEGFDTNFCGGLNMELFWAILFWLVPIWVFGLIPFTTFYYEADDGMLMAGTSVAPNPIKKSKFVQAACYQLIVIVVVFLYFLITYLLWSDTKVPVTHYQGGLIAEAEEMQNLFTYPKNNDTFVTSELINMDEGDHIGDFGYRQTVENKGSQDIVLRVNTTTFYAGLMAWTGWWLFCIFGGIGLMAMPLDLILAFTNRPRHLNAEEYAMAQEDLRARTNELVDIGELIKIEREQKAQSPQTTRFTDILLKRKELHDERQAILGFKQAVYLLEQDIEDFKASSASYENYNPLWPFVSLFLGICASIISFFWFLHILLYVLPKDPVAPFLNNFFKWFDNWFPLFGVLSVAIFTTYLLLCAVKGCFKFGLRFLCFQLHPMKVGKTYMSSFMFNIGLVLLCALPVVQFCQTAFADYAQFATIRQIFGVQIQNLVFFASFWRNHVFIYIFVVFNFLTMFYLLWKTKDQSQDANALRDRLKSRRLPDNLPSASAASGTAT